jgi:predicted  nucleic acid-binding Zn-ribbon protein
MNADLKNLIRLQSVDIAIQELREEIGAFPVRSRELDEKLSAAKLGVQTAADNIKNSQARRKQLESDIAAIEAKISKYKEQLMSVRTNHEYKAMVKEIEFNQNSIGGVEDEILTLMVGSEDLDEALKSAEGVLKEDEQTVRTERVRIEELNAKDTRAMDAYVEERKTLEKEVSEDVLSRYDRIRKARGGVAVAKASDEACELCNVRMRPQVFQEIRKNDAIITCDSCSRILYDPENLDHPFEVA